jgi:hypothetical protein
LIALPAFAAQQAAEKVNTVQSIRVAAAPAGAAAATAAEVEIELHSSQEFPIRDQVVVLRIGNLDIMKSRSPADGSLNTLIFSLPADQFAQLADGAQMTVRYGIGDPEGAAAGPAAQAAASRWRWDFGKLDKSLLVQ